MADIVNRVLKILFLVFLCFHLISSQSEIATEDVEYWPDYEAGTKELHHAERSRRDLKSKSRKASNDEVILPRPQVQLVTVPPPTIGIVPAIANQATSNVCLPNPCQNGGVCGTDSVGAYMCACTLGYRGKFCQEAMMKCNQIGCKSITDCLSAPNGAICLCKLGRMTRLCESDMHTPSTWEKVRLVVSEQTIHTGEIIVGVVLGILALFAVLFGIHCHRVNVRRAIVRKRYKDILDEGIVPSEPPPDWCEISNDLLKKLICCKKGKTVFDAYKPKKSLTTIKQKEEELIHLLNSHAAALDDPNPSRRQYTQDDFQAGSQDLPSVNRLYSQAAMHDTHIPISKRASKEQGIHYSQMGRFDIDRDRDINRFPSRGSVKAMVDDINYSRNNHASLQKKYSSQDCLKKKHSRQSQLSYPGKRGATESFARLHKLESEQKYSDLDHKRKRNNVYDDNNDFEDDPVSRSSYKHRNNSARLRHNSEKSSRTKTKPVKYSNQEPAARTYRKEKYKVSKTMGNITNNFGNIKKSISNRRNARSNEFTKSLHGSPSRYLSTELEESINDITNTSDKYVTDPCSEEESVLDQKLLIMINEDTVKPDHIGRLHPYSSKNGNENAKSGRLSNGSADYSVLYHDNLSYYQQQSRKPSRFTSTYEAELAAENSNVNKNTERESKQPTSLEDPMFYGHLIDPSMKHDNLETTNWYWDHEPGMGMYDTHRGRRNRQELTTSNKGTETSVKHFENKDFDKISASRYDNRKSDLYCKTNSCSTEDGDTEKNSKEFIIEKNDHLKDTQSETCNTWSLNHKYSQIWQNKDETFQRSFDINKSIDNDISMDRLYARSFNEDGEKRYFVGNECAFRVGFETCDEKSQDNFVKMSSCLPSDYETVSLKQCSTPLQSSNQNGERVSSNIDNTPSTGAGTPTALAGTPSTPIATENNTTVINANIKDGDTRVNVESNDSETEVEL